MTTDDALLPDPTEGGSVDGDGPVAAVDVPPTTIELDDLGELAWHSAYDRESVERYFAEVDAARATLLAGISAAEARVAEAEQGLAAQVEVDEARLGALVVAARAEMDRLEDEHRQAVQRLRAEAFAEAAELLAVAEREAADIARASESVSRLSVAGASTTASPTVDEDPVLPVVAAAADAAADIRDHSDAR